MADKMSARPAPIRKSRSFRSFPNLLQPIADKKMSSLRSTDRILIARVPKDAQVEPRKQTTPGGPNEPSQPGPDRQTGKIVQTQQQSPRAPPPKEEDVSLRYKHLGLTDVVADVDNGDARDNTLSKQARRLSTFLYDEDGIAVPRDLVHTKEDSIKRKKGKSNIVYYEDSTQITVDNDALANDFANQHERQTTLRKESDEHFEVHVTEETLVNGQVDENIIVVDFPNDVPIYSATFPPGVHPKDSVNNGRNDTEKTYYPLVPASERNDKKDGKGREPELVEWPFNVDLYDYDDVVYMGHVHEDDVGYGSLDRNIKDIRSETVSPRKGFSQDDKLSVRATGRIQSADRSVDYGSYFLEPITHDRNGYGAHGAETTKYHQVARWAKHVQSYHNSLSHPSQNIDAFGSATTGLFRFSETNLVEVEYNESVYDESEGEDVKSIPPVVPIFHDEESTRFAEEEATAVDRRPSRQIVYDENGHGAHLIAQTTSVTQASVAVRNVMQGPVAPNSLPRSTTEYSAKADFLPPKANSATKFANVKHISTDSSASDLCNDCIDVKQAAVTLEQMLQRRLSSGQSNVGRDGVRPSREPTRAEQPPRDVEPKPKTTRPSYVVVAQTKETSAVANETPSMASEKDINRPRMNFTTKKKELSSSLGRSAYLQRTENVSKGVQIGALTPNQNETKSESKVYLPDSKRIETEIAMQPTTPTKPARVESFTIRSGLETGEDDSMSSRSVNSMIQRFESIKRSGRTEGATDHWADGQGRDDSVVPSVFI
ncbi:Hypp1124 [Branchiostoma lanceolatum]|uniref:Hypp1124 protein n=1 Tax=Branchiostoma lanceolatum TaxID=7740 RepID=A0A8J9ZER0_BRALA|nr:Hypp1124 [Branchiostoma lanceolatum]